MQDFFIHTGIAITLFIFISLYRVFRGPSVFDRLLAAGSIGSKALVLIVLIGFIYDRIDMFIDITLAYAVLNFVGTIALAKYFDAFNHHKKNSSNEGQESGS